MDIEDETRGCGELWAAVILQALADAQGRSRAVRGDHRDDDGNVIDVQAEALEWFTDAGPDFLEVCDLAGMNPDVVRRVALNPLPESFNHRLDCFRSAERTVVYEDVPCFTRAELARLDKLAARKPLARRRRSRLTPTERRERNREHQRRRRVRLAGERGEQRVLVKSKLRPKPKAEKPPKPEKSPKVSRPKVEKPPKAPRPKLTEEERKQRALEASRRYRDRKAAAEGRERKPKVKLTEDERRRSTLDSYRRYNEKRAAKRALKEKTTAKEAAAQKEGAAVMPPLFPC